MFSVFRSPGNPFLTPSSARAFEALGTFNPSVVQEGQAKHLFYRAMSEPDQLRTPGRGFSTVGYAVSKKDGPWEGGNPIVVPTEDWEAYGCEDPRATFFEGRWYVFYTALGGYPFGPDNIKAAVAIGDAPHELREKHLITPFNAKATTLFPERIGGDAVLLLTAHTDRTDEHPFPTIGIARSKNIENFWNPEFWNEWHAHLSSHAFPDVRRADTEHMEIGAAPLLTPEGWLLIYSHIQNYYDEHTRLFGVEAVLLDRHDPAKIIAKTEFPFLVPEESYEKYGVVSNVVFPTGATLQDDTLTVYYGGADTVSACASLSFSDLVSSMRAETRDSFVTRKSETPLLSPIPEHEWEEVSVSNAAAIDLDGSVHLLYRGATKDNVSNIGYARLADGVHVDERLPEPVYAPRVPEEVHGTEDPRLTRIDDTLYITYTAYNGTRARGALSTISVADFLAHKFNWSPPRLLTPDTIDNKDICLFPERIDGNVVLLHRIDPDMSIDFFEELPPEHEVNRSIEILSPRPGMWDGVKVGATAPPIRVPEGWLLVYHAVGPDFVYRLGAALLDESATQVLARTASPIMEPVLGWEKEGIVPNVIFCCGIVVRGDDIYLYYGGADTALGVATISQAELLRRLQPKL